MTDHERDRLQSLIAEIMEAERRGDLIDRQELLNDHPDQANSLRDFFANHDRVELATDIEPPTVTLPPVQASEEVMNQSSNPGPMGPGGCLASMISEAAWAVAVLTIILLIGIPAFVMLLASLGVRDSQGTMYVVMVTAVTLIVGLPVLILSGIVAYWLRPARSNAEAVSESSHSDSGVD